ncbi:MAG: transporter associated domain-containing protein [Pseudomonadota bacterium]|jgi:magnesium and cobalt transporter
MSESRGPLRPGWLQRVLQQFSDEPQDREDVVEELREASERGLFDADSFDMLEGVLAVGELKVRDIMVARSMMAVVGRDDAPAALLAAVVESGHSRFPVLGEDRDEVVGILLAKDLLRHFVENVGQEFEIREFVRPAIFVPESKRLNVLLREFRKNHNHMAIVVDEYGGVAGLVTIEDVIEQIVGDIADEHDTDDEQAIRCDRECEYTVQALTRIEDFNEYFGATLADDDCDTIGGLVSRTFGRLPRRGDVIQIGDFEFKAVRVSHRRIESLKVLTSRVISPPPADD